MIFENIAFFILFIEKKIFLVIVRIQYIVNTFIDVILV